MARSDDGLLLYAHIGDLHVTAAAERNYVDLLSIAAQIETECAPLLDFVYLPGDNADNGRPEQYRLIRTALKMLSVPVHAITGDHDMEQGSLENFYGAFGAETLPKAVTVGAVRCLFLDVCGAGAGGPDFRLEADQRRWLETELDAATGAGQRCALFVHTYPADLKQDGQAAALNALIARHKVALVDMGHTHYNELANDGATIFAATRSTGQIEEGPVGYTLAALDGGVVSWRFTYLDEGFPFVLVTAPADHRLVTDASDRDHVPRGTVEARAVVFGARAVSRCEARIEDGPWIPMTRTDGDRRYRATLPVPDRGLVGRHFDLTVRAVDDAGRPAQDRVAVAVEGFTPGIGRRDGSDADAIGAWPERGILGSQLGPNRNGLKPS